MSDELFHPGQQVPESGIYQVLHYRHRLYHEVTITRDAVFPLCSECEGNVRYRLVHTAPPIKSDRNFAKVRAHKAG
jgi:hypothetical protein